MERRGEFRREMDGGHCGDGSARGKWLTDGGGEDDESSPVVLDELPHDVR